MWIYSRWGSGVWTDEKKEEKATGPHMNLPYAIAHCARLWHCSVSQVTPVNYHSDQLETASVITDS